MTMVAGALVVKEGVWKSVRCQVGVGDRVRFWQDRWCGDLSLAVKFRLIFAIATDAEDLVASVRGKLGDSVVWNVRLRRHVQD